MFYVINAHQQYFQPKAMISPNPITGTFLHALGGISASTCYVPFQKTSNWSWNTYWLVQATFAWLIFPIVIGFITVPDLFGVFSESESNLIIKTFLLGCIYGFGGMCFGYAIKQIGYSLTYTISIGISAILGTIVPLLLHGTLVEHFSKPGGLIILSGMSISVIGISLCGFAGYRKENDLKAKAQEGTQATGFNMQKGLLLTIIAGVLSAVFGISLEIGSPIAAIAGEHGAGHFEGNANLLLSTGGAFITNFIWFTVVGIRQNTLKEMTDIKSVGGKTITLNFIMSILSGALWYGQFFFYGMAHVRMGPFKFASWVIHMSMLIFFSYLVGLVMKEWKDVTPKTYITLIIALLVLVASFVIMTIGSSIGAETVPGH